MKSLDLRESVLDFIKHKADRKFLRLVKAMAKSYSEEEVLDKDTLERYNKDIDKAIKEVEIGNFYTQEEVEKMANNW